MIRRIYSLLIVLFFAYSNCAAQVETKRTQRDIEERSLMARQLFEQEDRDFAIRPVPEKWKNESAVVIFQKDRYAYPNFGKKVDYEIFSRAMILLQDRNSVREFSEFYFQFRDSKKHKELLGIRIIKPDGRIRNIDIKDSELVTSSYENIPSIFRRRLTQNDTYRKIAIEDLEPGDVIDYFELYYQQVEVESMTDFAFPVESAAYAYDYPVVGRKFTLKTKKSFHVNVHPVLMPELKHAGEEDGCNLYELELKNQEKFKNIRWSIPSRTIPHIRFQVVRSQVGIDKSDFIISDPPGILYKINPDLIKQFVTKKIDKSEGKIWKDHNKEYIKFFEKESPEASLYTFYYGLRYLYNFNSSYRRIPNYTFEVYESKAFFDNFNFNEPPKLSDEEFIKSFIKAINYLNKNKGSNFTYEILVTTSVYDGNVAEQVFSEGLLMGIKVKGGKREHLFFNPSAHLNPEEYHYSIEGQDYLVISKQGKDWVPGKEGGTFSVLQANENVEETEFKIIIANQLDSVTVTEKISETGYRKLYTYSNLIFKKDYKEDFEKFREDFYSSYVYGYGADVNNTPFNHVKLRKEFFAKDKQFNVDEFLSFDVNETGRWKDYDTLVYTQEYITGDLISKAGKHHMFHVGKLIGGQVEIAQEEEDREKDIHLDYARTFVNKLEIEIPEGFSVKGVGRLNMHVDNDAGMFSSSATQENNRIVIETRKVYKKAFVPKEQWPEMIAFLNTANDFMYRKLLLVKK